MHQQILGYHIHKYLDMHHNLFLFDANNVYVTNDVFS